MSYIIDHPINGFFKEYSFLSNFYLVPVEYEDITYPSSENAYQAAKTESLDLKILMANDTPGGAKQRGRRLKLRDNWDNIKIDIMLAILRNKFNFITNAVITNQLLDTNNSYLEETNYWKDRFWGVYNGKGRNNLGKLLMVIRNERSKESLISRNWKNR